MSEKYVVDGYCFQSREEADNAKNEVEGIEYLKRRTNFKNPQSVLAVYNKIVEKQLFKTPIGYGFLREMQQLLYSSPEIEENMVKDIPVMQVSGKSRKEKKRKAKTVSLLPEEEEKKYKNRIVNMVIVNIILVIVIIAGIIITNNSSNTNILNYRDRLEREYQEKEDSLAIWAGQLKEKEHQLNNMEQGE